MTDFYKFGNVSKRDLRDIVYYDVLNEKETDEVKIETLSQYITDTLKLMVKDREIQRAIVTQESVFNWSEVFKKDDESEPQIQQ